MIAALGRLWRPVPSAGNAAEGRLGIGDLRINQFSRRYIFHLLARLTAFTEAGAGRGEHFEHYVAREMKNPFDIEHIWSSNVGHHSATFVTQQEFQEWRDHVGSLVLLPADVNRSLQDKPYDYKVARYASQNFYAASLSASPYQHQPQFEQFRTKLTLPFQAFVSFGKAEQQSRRHLVQCLVDQIWSPARLQEFLP